MPCPNQSRVSRVESIGFRPKLHPKPFIFLTMARGRKPHVRKRHVNSSAAIQDAGIHDIEEQVDDLAVAAAYAAAVYTGNATPVSVVIEPLKDGNEICLTDCDDDENEDNKADNEKDTETTAKDIDEEHATEGSESSDESEAREEVADESDDEVLDVDKERSKLQKMGECDERGESLVPPKTENEVDSYQTPLTELEEKFQINLTVDVEKKLNNSQHLCRAGTIKNHLVKERTLIVESRGENVAPLDEGSLLVIQIQMENDNHLVTLGRIFEVFGPVRRPLYSVRIPPPQQTICNKGNASIEKKRPQAENTSENLNGTDKPKDDTTGDSPPPSEECEQAHATTAVKVSSTKTESMVEDSKQESSKCTSDATPKEDLPDLVEPDPWSPRGKYTCYLCNNPDLEAFFIQDEAKIIDAEAMLRMSAKGCGKWSFGMTMWLDRNCSCCRLGFRCIKYL